MTLTADILFVVVGLLIAYDIWTLVRRGYQTTISWVTYTWAQKYPIIAFALGVVFGHLFWPNSAAVK